MNWQQAGCLSKTGGRNTKKHFLSTILLICHLFTIKVSEIQEVLQFVYCSRHLRAWGSLKKNMFTIDFIHKMERFFLSTQRSTFPKVSLASLTFLTITHLGMKRVFGLRGRKAAKDCKTDVWNGKTQVKHVSAVHQLIRHCWVCTCVNVKGPVCKI